jgi:nucleotide-binding universal stress UspA family protein
MARTRPFRVLVATDGSPNARAAVAVAVSFPWPRGARAHAVVAGRPEAGGRTASPLQGTLARSAVRIAARARRALAERWPDAEVVVADTAPVDAIVDEARRVRAGTIVLGWRGHGALRRLLIGSVSRGVIRQARCPVLVVRRRPRRLRTFVVGVDGSTNARRAVRFAAALTPPRGGRVTVVRVAEPVGMPASAGRLPGSIRAMLRSQVAALNAERLARAKRDVDRIAARLAHRGWSVRTSVRSGAPLEELLATLRATGADALVVGARGSGGVSRLLLGSVAEGALNHAPVPVLVVR